MTDSTFQRRRKPTEDQDARALKIRRAKYWTVLAFQDAKARWMSPHERTFRDRPPNWQGVQR